MALMLSRGEIEALYVPDERTQEIRTLTRSRSEATTRVTRIVNHLSSMLRSHGIRIVVCRKFVRVIYRMLTSGVGWCNPLPVAT